MLESFQCYFRCIMQSGTNFVLFGFYVGALTLGIIFMATRKPQHMFLSQGITAASIIEGFRQMSCPMGGLVWIYFGIILGALVFAGVMQVAFDNYVRSHEIHSASMMGELKKKLGTDIYLLDTQKMKAFTHRRRIYLSVGLVELLEPEEIEAVCAHELYHARHTPNRLTAIILALASLWIRSYRDDAEADRFAAELIGHGPLVSALEKLGVRDAHKRARRLAA